jgi:hypothetical protein
VIRRDAEITNGIDHSGRIGAQYPRRHDLDARQSTDNEEVQVIEGSGPNANADLANARFRLR